MSAGVCRKKKTYKICSIFKLQTTLFWMFYVQRAQLGQPASHRKKKPNTTHCPLRPFSVSTYRET